MNSICYLIGVDSTDVDDLGQPIETETRKMIFCEVATVTRNEWFDAGRNGLNATYVLKTWKDNYNNELTVEYDGVRYGVYRTYFNSKNNTIELYLEKKAGA